MFVLWILLLVSYEAQGAWYCMNDVGRWLVVHRTSHLSRQEGLVKKRKARYVEKWDNLVWGI